MVTAPPGEIARPERGGVAELVLQQLRHDLRCRNQQRAGRQHDEEASAELAPREHLDVDQRLRSVEFLWNEQQQRGHGNRSECHDE
jgi:hypothetical protein